MTEEQLEKRRARNRRYVARHKAEHAARCKAWATAHKEYRAAYNRKRRADNPDHEKAIRHAYYKRNAEKLRAQQRELRKRNPARTKTKNRRAEAKRRKRMEEDAKYYAKYRARKRISTCKAAFRKGKIYRPSFTTRIPDWCTKGKVLNVSSRFLFENLTQSDIGWVKETMWERMKK